MNLVSNRMVFSDCGCIIHYTYDADLIGGPEIVWFTHLRTEYACPGHEGLSGQEQCDAVHRENDARARAIQTAIDTLPAKLKGDGIWGLAEGVRPNYTWLGKGADRTMTLDFPGASLTANEKAQLRAAMVLVKSRHKINLA